MEVRSFEATEDLSDLLDRVASGEVITITKGGRPMARLVPALGPFDRQAARDVADRIWEMGQRNRLGNDIKIRDLIDEGRR